MNPAASCQGHGFCGEATPGQMLLLGPAGSPGSEERGRLLISRIAMPPRGEVRGSPVFLSLNCRIVIQKGIP